MLWNADEKEEEMERRSRMLTFRRGWQWIQRDCFVFTCLTAVLLTARVSADLPFDLHLDPCGNWPDLDVDAPCKCDVCLKSGKQAAVQTYTINAAYNRPVTTSSTWNCWEPQYLCFCDGRRHLLPCGAVNGYVSPYFANGCHSKLPFYNAVLTNYNDKIAYVIVDFQRPYTISYIALTIGYFMSKPDWNKNWQRWASVYESVDAQLCHTWPSYHNKHQIQKPPNDMVVITCKNPIRGSRYRLQKIYEAYGVFCPVADNCHELFAWEQFGIGELQVWVCKSGYYGRPMEGCSNTCPTLCSTVCDNYYGCVTDHTQIAHNVAIGRPVCASKSPGQISCDRDPSKTVDGGGVSFMRREWCYWSGVGVRRFHFIRIELDGGYFVTHVKLDTAAGDEQKPHEFVVLVRMVSATDGYEAGEVCGEANGIPDENHFYSITCASCSKQLSDCPRGRFVTVKEFIHRIVNLCEIEVFGVAFKEDSTCGDCVMAICRKGEACVGGKCRVQIGGGCSSDEDCQDSTAQQCSDTSKTCTLRVGQHCGQKENLCYERLLCDPSMMKCSFRHSDNCTGHSRHCFLGLVCDINFECKKKVGDRCNANTDCVAGAVCVSDKSQGSETKCQCSEHANTLGTLCRPKDDNPPCTSPLKRGQDFTCRVEVGEGPCDTQNNRCDDGAQCINDKCQANDNAPCKPTAQPEQCGENRTCDPVVLHCRMKTGKPCSDTSPCVQGTTCQTSKNGTKVCHIQALGDCSANTDYCVAGYVCPVEGTKVCMVGNGEPCDDYVEKMRCLPGSVCVADKGGVKRCMLDIGTSCTPHFKCRPGAVCSKIGCAWKVAQPCMEDECADGLTCDLDGICRITRGGDCTEFTGYCQLRASCVHGTCKCVESVDNNDVGCPLKTEITGIPTSPCKACEEADTTCIECKGSASCQNGTCVCLDKLALAADLTCKPDIGSSCSNNNTAPGDIICANGAICEKGNCAIPPGQPCSKEHSFNCMSGSVCDDSVCRLNVNVDCSGDRAGLCLQGWVCDAATHKCKMPVCAVPFSSCQGNELESPCVSGAMCNKTDGQCYCQTSLSSQKGCMCQAKAGLVSGDCSGGSCTDESAMCTENKCVCKPGYEVSPVNLTCTTAEGGQCTTSDSCAPGKECDTKTSTCKRKVGSPCNSSKTGAESECTHDADCELGTCRLKVNADCSNSPPNSCQTGLFCETSLSMRCKSYPHAYCDSATSPNTCLSGARCVESSCQCDTNVTEAKGLSCVALAGMVSGACLLGQSCRADGAVCVNNVCSCPPNTETSLETLSCDVAGFSQASSDSLLDITLILCGVVVTVAACGVLVLLAVRRQSQRRDDLQAKVAARKAEQVALATEDKPEEDKPEEDKDTESDHAHSTSTEDGGSLAEVKADVNKDYVADQSDVDMAYAAEAKDLHNEAEVSGSDFLPNDPPSMVAEDGRWTLFEAENPNCTPGEMVGEMAL